LLTKHALRLYALAATAGCGYLLIRPPPGPSTSDEVEACRAPGRTFSSSRFVPSGGTMDGAGEDALAQLLATRPGAPRCAALARLPGSVPDAAAADAIGALLRAPIPYTERGCAIDALAQLADSGSLELLLALARDVETRDTALTALGRRSDGAARRALLSLAEDEDDPLRVPALMALAAMGEPAVVPILIDALADARLDERYPLVTALGQSGDARALPVLERLATAGSPGERTLALEALAQHQTPGSFAVIRRIIESQPMLAAAAANVLANVRSAESEALLMELAVHPSGQVASAALSALSASDAPAVRALMLRVAGSGNGQSENAAFAYFARHPDEASLDLMMERCTSGREQACNYVAEGCVQVGTDDALERLVEMAESTGSVRVLAFQALSRVPGGAERARELALASALRGGGEAEGALMVLGRDDHPDARRRLLELARADSPQAASAMQQLAMRGDADSVRTLVELSKRRDGREDLRSAALNALYQTNSDEASAAAEDALRTGGPDLRGQAANVLASTRGAAAEASLLSASRASEKEPQALSGITMALAQLGTPAAVDRIEQIAGKGVPGASEQALAVLMENAPARAARLSESLITSRDANARAAGMSALGGLPNDVARRIVEQVFTGGDENLMRIALNNGQLARLGDAERNALLTRVAQNGALSAELRQELSALAEGNTVSAVGEAVEVRVPR
jgi:HEAT repeat protein